MKQVNDLKALSTKFINFEFSLFFLQGIANTVITYLLYLALVQVLSCQLAYTTVFILGVLFSYYFNSKYTFKQEMRWSILLQFIFVYLAQSLSGLMLIHFLTTRLNINKEWVLLFVMSFTFPLSFFLSRWVIKKTTSTNKSL
jgi:putative flippase GtrA